MKDDRLRVAVSPEYLSAIGIAMFCFAELEWNAVWCCERIKTGSLSELSKETAGGIAKTLIAITATLAASPDKERLSGLATRFSDLVETRNAILHAEPGTETDGAQRLFRNDIPWTPDTLNDAADAFTECSIELNGCLYGFLKTSL